MAKAQRQRREIASWRYRSHLPCRKVVRLARVPYYARPRLTLFLSAHVSLGSGSIRRALADVNPSQSLGIKLVNGRKKWSHDNARSFSEAFTAPSAIPPSTLLHDSLHFHVAVTLDCWHFYFHETCIRVVVIIVTVIVVYMNPLIASDDTLNKDCAYM